MGYVRRLGSLVLALGGLACSSSSEGPPGGREDSVGGSGGGDTTSGGSASGGRASGGSPEGPAAGGLASGGTGTPSAGGRSGGGQAPMEGVGGASASGGELVSAGGTIAGGAAGSGGEPATGGAPANCPPHVPLTTPVGYGRLTTGGGNTAPVTVRSFAEAETALAAYRAAFKDKTASALVLHYAGTFDYTSITDVCAQHEKEAQILEIKEMENVTFRGTSGSSANFGLKINRAKNVIVQNMRFGLLPGGGDSDAITIEGNGTNGDVENVWIDHNEFFSSTKDDCPDAGDTEFDGLVDAKKGARYITISYNHFHDHQKTNLLGYSDTDDTERYITFHHNHFERLASRVPLQRFGYTHIYNNYYHHITSSGINVRMGGLALIEANFFEDTLNPVTSRYSDSVGYWDLRENVVGPNVTFDTEEDTLANADDWKTTKVFPASELTYDYAAESGACAKATVLAEAGARL